MIFSLPWAFDSFGGNWAYEKSGFTGLLLSIAICLGIGILLRYLGSDDKKLPLRREAVAIVGLSWILATFLGSLPYIISQTNKAPGRAMTVADAVFETQSGLSTTGASVIGELEDARVIPRTILFWRHTTIFLGGLGVMILFIALLGQGASSKTLFRIERSPISNASPDVRVRQSASALLKVYLGLNFLLVVILMSLGLSFFDAVCHSFSTVATGGFSTFNLSIGHFSSAGYAHASLIEWTIIVFMFLGGTNLLLIYWFVIGKRGYLLNNIEWRTYAGIVLSATLIVFVLGLFHNDLQPFNKTNTVAKITAPQIEPLKNTGSETKKRQTSKSASAEQTEPVLEEKPVEKPKFNSETSQAEKSDLIGGLGPQDGFKTFAASSVSENDFSSPAGSEKKKEPEQGSDSTVQKDQQNSSDIAWYSRLRTSMFHVISLMTSTGFCTSRFESWNSRIVAVLLILMLIGGCSGSTAGGSKVIRWIIGAKALHSELEHSFRPSVVRCLKIGENPLEKETVSSVYSFLLLYLLAIILIAFTVIMIEPDTLWNSFQNAEGRKMIDLFSATLASVSNIGPGIGLVGSQGNYGDLSSLTKLILSFAMLLGRLELYIILVLFTPSFWHQR